jgi:hypothetical protein
MVEGLKAAAERRSSVLMQEGIEAAAADAEKAEALSFAVAIVAEVGPSKETGELVLVVRSKTSVKLERKDAASPVSVSETASLFGGEED